VTPSLQAVAAAIAFLLYPLKGMKHIIAGLKPIAVVPALPDGNQTAGHAPNPTIAVAISTRKDNLSWYIDHHTSASSSNFWIALPAANPTSSEKAQSFLGVDS
jgi:hypothetical protein